MFNNIIIDILNKNTLISNILILSLIILIIIRFFIKLFHFTIDFHES